MKPLRSNSMRIFGNKQLSYLDSSFLEDVYQIMKELNLNFESPVIEQKVEKIKEENFPAYLLLIELNKFLFEHVIKDKQFKGDGFSRIALMQLFLLNPLQFYSNYKQFSKEDIKKTVFKVLNAPRNIFWNWGDNYSITTREVFSLICSHPNGLTKEEIVKIAKNQNIPRVGVLRELKENSFLRKYHFIILESGKYYPFFSPKLSEKSILKAEEGLLRQIGLLNNLLLLEYKMPKYHIDFVMKVLRGAKSLSRVLKEFINYRFHPSNSRIVKILLKTNRKEFSRFTISRVKERFEALKLDGLIEKDNAGYYLTDLGKKLVWKNFIILTSNYVKVLLLEERIVKKGHNYWSVEEYLNFMRRLGLIDLAASGTRIYRLTEKGENMLKGRFDLNLIVEDILWQMA